jgi:hypothetical protein
LESQATQLSVHPGTDHAGQVRWAAKTLSVTQGCHE